MRINKSLSTVLVPVILAIFFLSLPQEKNTALNHQLARVFTPFWQLLHAEPPIRLQELQRQEIGQWLAYHSKEAVASRKEAEQLFSEYALSKLLIGQVIQRSATSWSSTLWINLGKNDNPKNGPPHIAKNSPVLSGDSVIGVVEYVGKKTSLVRLITDSELTPAVRIARGGVETKRLAKMTDELASFVQTHDSSLSTAEQKEAFLFLLAELKRSLKTATETEYLAKGELQGHGEPLWRSPGSYLRGIGFNYDFKDEHGPARDLRSGEPIDIERECKTVSKPLPLIQNGDLLVTSGMDGIFPEGLKIAKVASVLPLKEGSYAYEILATPTAENILDLKTVIVLPPQELETVAPPTKAAQLLDELDIS